MRERIAKLRAKLEEENLDGLLVNNPQNRYYLSGFTGTAGTLLISRKEAVLITDFRYVEQAAEEATEFEVVEHGSPKLDTLQSEVKRLGITSLGFEARQESYHAYQRYQEQLDVELVATKQLVKQLRRIKDDSEVATIKEAVKLADFAFEQIIDYIEPGMTEQEVSLELEYIMRRQGASQKAFDFIVASGTRGALPHGVASEKELAVGELLTMDLGCTYQRYNSDLTRNLIIGSKPTAKQQEIYQIVLEAQLAALEAIEPGKSKAEIDQIARDIISQAGYGEQFGHSLGHGVGLEVHEKPSLAANQDGQLLPGMVVTVEPGIYIPDWGGVRIEDMVVVTENGCEILTTASKELIRV
ncbi:MAG: M24 family metallopeptidase [Bacillota bacterium]